MAKSAGRPKANGASEMFAGQSQNGTEVNAPNGKAPSDGRSSKYTACASHATAAESVAQAQSRNRVLLDERPLVLLPSLAKAVGVDGAIVLQQLHYYLGDPNCGREHNGHRWIYNTYEQWRDDFPFWPLITIRRIFGRLERRGLIIACQPETRRDGCGNRRKYYRIDYEQLEKIVTAAPRTRARARDPIKVIASDVAKMIASRTETSSHIEPHLIDEETHRTDETHVTDASHRDAFVSKDLASPPFPTPALRDTPRTRSHARTRTRSSESNSWRDEYTPEALEIIDAYNARLVPRGWRSVNRDSPELADALDTFGFLTGAELIETLDEAADERDRGEFYDTPRGNKLIRILWANY
jgi:hypothetical protein